MNAELSPVVQALIRFDTYMVHNNLSLPVELDNGSQPFVVTIPEEPFVKVLERLSWSGEPVNLVVDEGQRYKVFAVYPVGDEVAGDPVAFTADNPVTVAQVVADMADMRKMCGDDAPFIVRLSADTLASVRVPEYV